MRTFEEPALVPVPDTGSLCEDVERRFAADPNALMLRRRVGSVWQPVSVATFRSEVIAVAKGLVAIGVRPGERVALMSATRYEWTLADYAIWYAGAVTVPIYETSSPEQVEWICRDSEAVAIFLEHDRHELVFAEARAQLPQPVREFVFDGGAIAELTAAGADVDDAEIDARRAALRPDTMATIIYTSGTTGRPKGCILTHGNFMSDVRNVVNSMPELFLTNTSSTLLFLPIAHVFGRVIQVGCIYSGTVLGHSADIKSILGDLESFRPTFLLAVPRVFEKVYNSAEQKAAAAGKSKIFATAADVAIAYSQSVEKGGPGLILRAKHAVFDRLVYAKLRAALGGEVSYAVSGGAPLGERLGHFFRGIGVTILEGYGLTETTGATTINRPDCVKVGTVGRPIPGAGIRIADDGEVMIAGGQVFVGYWHNEKATAEAMDTEGWFHSGDIGELDDEGFLRITGRKKELIVTAGGKNVAPAVLEDRLRANFLISQCMVVGDGRPYVAALITLDEEALAAWSGVNGLPAGLTLAEAAAHPQVLGAVSAAVDEANRAVSNAEAIKRFEILEVDWTEVSGQLTPSMKLKRNVVMADFAVAVERLYL